MDKQIISEAVNQIDDDLIEEAAVPSDICDDSQETETNETNFTAAGVEKYKHFGWQKIAAFAAALFLIAGAAGTGGWLSSNHGNNNNKHIADSSETEDTNNSKNTTSPTNITKDTNNNNNNNNNNKDNKNNSNITSNKTTQNEKKVTEKTTSKSSVKVTSSNTVNKADKILNSKILTSLAQKGNALTVKDFADYEHEETGSVWRFFIDEAEGYTLFIGGVTKKSPDYIRLYRGTRNSIPENAEYIDIRESDPVDFMNKNAVLSDALYNIRSLSPDAVISIRLSAGYGSDVPLSYDQINEILSLLKNISLIDKADGSYKELDGIYNDISIVLLNNRTINISLINPYFIIDGAPYKAEYEPCEALNEYVHSAILAYTPAKKEIKNNEVVCWHDEETENLNIINLNEKITTEIFPGFSFRWIGKEYKIVIEKNGEIQESIYEPHNAYFADINGDGYPELCASVTVGSGIIDSRIIVHDIHNNKTYDLSDRGNNDFVLFTENGELFAKKVSYYQNTNNFEKGRLAIDDDKIVFMPE